MSRTLPTTDVTPTLLPNKWVVFAVRALPIGAIAIGYLFDTLALPYLQIWWRQQNEMDPSAAPLRYSIILAILLALPAASAFATTTYLWLMAYRIFLTKTFPPRGYLILAKTAVLEGRTALKKAYGLLFFGALPIAIAMYVIWSVFAIFPDIKTLLKPLYG